MADNEKNERQADIQENESSPRINLAVIGGVVGAGIGLLSGPGTGRKVLTSIGRSEVMKVAGRELSRTAQEVIAEQAMMQFRKTASGYLDKGKGKLNFSKNMNTDDARADNSDDRDDISAQYDEMKEENQRIKDHLSKIDEKLDQLLNSKK